MKKYTLYLDESVVTNPVTKNLTFCVAGVIIDDEKHSIVETQVNAIKMSHLGTTDIPLHEKEIKEVNLRRTRNPRNPEFMYYRSNENCRVLYEELATVINSNDLKILGVSFDESVLRSYYKSSEEADSYSIALQLLIENYTHFLLENDGVGSIVLESRNENNHGNRSLDLILKSKYYYIQAMGTMFILPNDIQNRIIGIEFVPKLANNVGLQIADFIPNPFARKHAKMKKNKINMNETLYSQVYDGNMGMKNRFGMKTIP